MQDSSSPSFSPYRPETPPLLEQDSNESTWFEKALPVMHLAAGPTPEPSPTLIPQKDTTALDTRNEPEIPEDEIGTTKTPRPKSLDSPGSDKICLATLRKALSDSSLSTTVAPTSPPAPAPAPTPVLTEPSLDDFMSLSDDDIADGLPVSTFSLTPSTASPSHPPRFGLPPNPPISGFSPTFLKQRQMALHSPAMSRPATAAAFEAARIATRYHFDLVYIVNLWPITQTPCEPATGGSLDPLGNCMGGLGPVACINPKSGMTGRLLAAYGLPSLVSPFRLSAAVHLKVLRTEGWLEYRSEHASPDEFSRGYSCSFYSGRCATTATPLSPSTVSGKRKRSQPNNRGIVFAAYRLPRADGTTICSGPTDLEALYREAETLVEMLIDMHSTQRARNPIVGYGETGPMPSRPRMLSAAA
jgi:hypothetical protein